ncbi:MAG TPA: hypothetical protein PK637_00915 [Flavobacteriales bacterium]|nr:hypothetical protein [Flavobacteriales bacterium]HRE73645.1 hypothetical protein [Flavobacteriales bacterium]HRE95293.1 hypothetical protein [Flavobacteriales bacterium]HRJ35255.1 hypothetical protein [Flavobacteriales bacterium]HRJ37222.1 hypothetical protein [Flavobacteriales bacterium]
MKNWNASRIVLWITVVQFFFTLTFYWFSFQKIAGNNPVYDKGATETIESDVKQINKDYSISESNYKKAIDSLNTKLFYTDLLLKKEMFISKERKNDLENILSQRWDTLSTEIRLSECDSLRERTKEFIIAQEIKDTLFQNKIAQLTALHAESQKQLFTCDTTGRRLNDQINAALIHTKQCEELMKKQKRQNRILKIGMGIIAVITVGLAVK